jgi:hypothetical protein
MSHENTSPEPEDAAEQQTGGGRRPSACCASLLTCLEHHEKQGKFRLRDAAQTRATIERLEAEEGGVFDKDWERLRTYNLEQADHDEKWGNQHLEWAEAIRFLISHNAKAQTLPPSTP